MDNNALFLQDILDIINKDFIISFASTKDKDGLSILISSKSPMVYSMQRVIPLELLKRSNVNFLQYEIQSMMQDLGRGSDAKS